MVSYGGTYVSRRRYAPKNTQQVGLFRPRRAGACPRRRYGFAGMRRSSLPRTARRHTQVPPYIPGRSTNMVRRAGPMCPAAPYRVAFIGAWGRMRNRFVGRGILDASMAHSIRGRQGCRPLRFGWPVVRTGGGTHRCRPTFFIGGAFMFAVWHIMAPRRPPRRGGGGHGLRPGVAPSADGAGDDRGFRPLRRATGDAVPWTPAIF